MSSGSSASQGQQQKSNAGASGQSPRTYNYTENCLVHQDYTAIDQYAFANNLTNVKALNTKVITQELVDKLDRVWPTPFTTKARVQDQISELKAKQSRDKTLTDADAKLLRDAQRRLARFDRIEEISTEAAKAFPHKSTIGLSLTALKDVGDHHLIGKESEKLMLDDFGKRIDEINAELSHATNNEGPNDPRPRTTGGSSSNPRGETSLSSSDAQRNIDVLKMELEILIQRREQSSGLTNHFSENLRPINKLRKLQVKLIGLYLWTKAVEELKLDPNDLVARNRLFYSWVGCSITYDMSVRILKLPGLQKESTQQDRPMADALATGFEICGNFSNVQRTMTNAGLIDAEGVDKELATICIGGWGKDSSRKDVASQEKLHGWCAFPTSGDTSIPPHERFKVIDTTYASDNTGSKIAISNLWFIMNNDGFLRDHIPHQAEEQFVRRENTIDSHQQLWDRDLAVFENSTREAESINRPSLKPDNYILQEIQTLEVEYTAACEHLKMPDLHLLVGSLTNNKPVPFILQTGRWNAKFDIAKFAKDGSVHAFILAPYKGGQPTRSDSKNIIDWFKSTEWKVVARWQLGTSAADRAKEAAELEERRAKIAAENKEAEEMAEYKLKGTNITEEEQRANADLAKQFEEMERQFMEKQRKAEEQEAAMDKKEGKKPGP